MIPGKWPFLAGTTNKKECMSKQSRNSRKRLSRRRRIAPASAPSFLRGSRTLMRWLAGGAMQSRSCQAFWGEPGRLMFRRSISPYTALGEKDTAFGWIEKAMEERSTWLVYSKWEPRLDPLRSDPRFQDLLRRIGLPS